MRNLVFTSAGENTTFYKLWTWPDAAPQNFDIFVIYYGDSEENYEKYKGCVDYIEKRKGSKFQNFHWLWTQRPELFRNYDRFFILDDDILITCHDINRMFELSERFEICAPSFRKGSIISHKITKQKQGCEFEYTNFVEVNTPLFSRNALENLMRAFDPILIGWGIDYLYIWANGMEKKTSYAILHSISCINPHKKQKGGARELLKIANIKKRRKIWEAYAARIGCPKEFDKIVWSRPRSFF
jgi:hypothetical protein